MHRDPDDFDTARFHHDVVEVLDDPLLDHIYAKYTKGETGVFEIECRLGAFTRGAAFVPFTPLASWGVDWEVVEQDEWVRGEDRVVASGGLSVVKKHKVAHVDWPEWGLRLAVAHERHTPYQGIVSGPPRRMRRFTKPLGACKASYTHEVGTLVGRWEMEATLPYHLPKHDVRQAILTLLQTVEDTLNAQRDQYQAWLLFVRVQAWLDRPVTWPLRWGISPVLLSRKHLPDIHHAPDEWTVSLKADGQRMYVVLGHRLAIRVTPLGHIALLSVPHVPGPCRWSILDGEYVDYQFWAFDIIALRQKWVHATTDDKHALRAAFDGMHTAHNVSNIHWKPSYIHAATPLGAKAVDLWQTATAAPFPVDGLVFTHRRADVALKWRPYHTIDVLVRDGQVYAQDKAALHPLSLVVRGAVEGIVECFPKDGEWQVLRPRPDKTQPNQLHPTIHDAIQYQRQPIAVHEFLTSEYVAPSGRLYHDTMEDTHFRTECNTQKRQVLEQYAPTVLLDIGSGKGGDVHKWRHCPSLAVVIAVEPSHDQVQAFLTRCVTAGGRIEAGATQAHVITLDALTIYLVPTALEHGIPVFLWDVIGRALQGGSLLVSAFFSWHYVHVTQTVFETSMKQLAPLRQWPHHMVLFVLDQTYFPATPPPTALTIRRTAVRQEPGEGGLRGYVRSWALQTEQDRVSVHWPHWEQAIEETMLWGGSLVNRMAHFQYRCLSNEALADLHGAYRPWGQAYRKLVLCFQTGDPL